MIFTRHSQSHERPQPRTASWVMWRIGPPTRISSHTFGSSPVGGPCQPAMRCDTHRRGWPQWVLSLHVLRNCRRSGTWNLLPILPGRGSTETVTRQVGGEGGRCPLATCGPEKPLTGTLCFRGLSNKSFSLSEASWTTGRSCLVGV